MIIFSKQQQRQQKKSNTFSVRNWKSKPIHIQVIWWRHFPSEITNQRRAENSFFISACQPWSNDVRSKRKIGLWCFLRKKIPKFHHKSIRKICKNTISRGKHLAAWMIYFVTLKLQNNYWKMVWKRSCKRLAIHVRCVQSFPKERIEFLFNSSVHADYKLCLMLCNVV